MKHPDGLSADEAALLLGQPTGAHVRYLVRTKQLTPDFYVRGQPYWTRQSVEHRLTIAAESDRLIKARRERVFREALDRFDALLRNSA